MTAVIRALLVFAVAAVMYAGAVHPAPAAASSQRVGALTRAIQTTSARANELQTRLTRISARLDRTDSEVAMLESQLSWWDRALDNQSPGSRGLHGVGRRPLGLLRSLARARRALAAAERYATTHPVLQQLVAAERRVQQLTADRRRSLTGIQFPQPAAGLVAAPNTTRGLWAARLLDALHTPSCQRNLVSVVAWETAENTSAAWNPLATTLPAPGASRYNGSGVRDYPTRAAGIAATVDTLRLGYYRHGYGWIVYRLSQCAPPTVTAQAINASDWCRACAGGRYVTDTVADVARSYVQTADVTVGGGPR